MKLSIVEITLSIAVAAAVIAVGLAANIHMVAIALLAGICAHALPRAVRHSLQTADRAASDQDSRGHLVSEIVSDASSAEQRNAEGQIARRLLRQPAVHPDKAITITKEGS